jgi:hypothetical protein
MGFLSYNTASTSAPHRLPLSNSPGWEGLLLGQELQHSCVEVLGVDHLKRVCRAGDQNSLDMRHATHELIVD